MTANASGTASGFATFDPRGEPGNSATGAECVWTNQILGPNGVDRFWRRDHASPPARRLSPDPAGLAAVSVTSPQPGDEHSYVLNDPASSLDALGPDGYYLADCSQASPSGFHSHDGQLCYGDSPADQGISYQWLGPPFMQCGALVNPLPGAGSGGSGGSEPLRATGRKFRASARNSRSFLAPNTRQPSRSQMRAKSPSRCSWRSPRMSPVGKRAQCRRRNTIHSVLRPLGS